MVVVLARNKYSYKEKKAYWQGVGFGMATVHSFAEQGDYVKGMHKNKVYNSFSAGLKKSQ